jgi:hypothetical protein
MIYYAHRNAQHHGFVKDFRDWEFSSYHDIVRNDNTLVAAQRVLQRFGSAGAFENAHIALLEDPGMGKYIIEY